MTGSGSAEAEAEAEEEEAAEGLLPPAEALPPPALPPALAELEAPLPWAALAFSQNVVVPPPAALSAAPASVSWT